MSRAMRAPNVDEPAYLTEARAANFGNPTFVDAWRSGGRTPHSLDAIGDDVKHFIYARDALVARYAWAIPDNDALALIARYAPVIEIGAGTGYWALLLRERGVDVLAYDIEPPTTDAHANSYHRNELAVGTAWTEVLPGGPDMAAAHPERALFLCWPPYDEPMAAQCVRAYTGDTLIYIGEMAGGCTGDDDFHTLLATEWEERGRRWLPQWRGIHDGLFIYTRAKTSSERGDAA